MTPEYLLICLSRAKILQLGSLDTSALRLLEKPETSTTRLTGCQGLLGLQTCTRMAIRKIVRSTRYGVILYGNYVWADICTSFSHLASLMSATKTRYSVRSMQLMSQLSNLHFTMDLGLGRYKADVCQEIVSVMPFVPSHQRRIVSYLTAGENVAESY